MPIAHRFAVSKEFFPPIVTRAEQGCRAFRAYDRYYEQMLSAFSEVHAVFLVPCATKKPIHRSPLQQRVFKKFATWYGAGRDLFVVSEPVTLIYYPHLSEHEQYFMYDYPCRLLSAEARKLFVQRLTPLLVGRDVIGCLPSHHADIIDDVIGKGWTNYWQGDMFDMIKRGSALS